MTVDSDEGLKPEPQGTDAGAETPFDAGTGHTPGIIVGPEPGTDPGDDGGVKVDPVPTEACLLVACTPGQRCESNDAGAACIDNTCEELGCGEKELCEPHPAGGNICLDISCSLDTDCKVEEHCSEASLCEADVCTGDQRRCDAGGVLQCSSNGASETALFACASDAYFESACSEVSLSASCSCQDDWDCPADTRCEVDRCEGTGRAPTCTLPPIPFSDLPPAVEIHWGGDSRDNDSAHDGTPQKNPAPWASSSHVWSTPMVANLDDDNADGLVNELDFPEIVFVSYTAPDFDGTGIVRAIHGGGPNKGKDFFARCGDAVWKEGDLSEVACDGGDARSHSAPLIADLTDDGVPEIIYVTQRYSFRVLSNTGEQLLESPDNVVAREQGPMLNVANLDFDGLPELIVGASVFNFGIDGDGKLFLRHMFTGDKNQGKTRIGYASCIADVNPAPGQEVLAGTTLYRMPVPAACAAPPCTGKLEVVWDASVENTEPPLYADGMCAIADVWGAASDAPGPLNPPDGRAEAILIADGNLVILDAETGALIHQRPLGGGDGGGAPNVDDFDGDGFMEIASALQDFYMVVDLQEPTVTAGNCPAWGLMLEREEIAGQMDNPNIAAGSIRNPGGIGAITLASGAVQAGQCTVNADCNADSVCNQQAGQCVCLHNGWFRSSDDDSSRVTSSSVFDFNGDGAAEVLYNDECEFRVYNGVTGDVLYNELSRSRTALENPVVADVDNDGNAEVVTVMNTEGINRCDDDPVGPLPGGGTARLSLGPNGIRVWGDPTDTWVAARRIWNQFSYHVTNVTESGKILARPPESWKPFNGRTYNTYRSQPRNYGVAPDLVVSAVSVFSPDVACGKLGETLNIVYEIKNQGDLRVGPGVEVSFFGTWDGVEEPLRDAAGPIIATLGTSLEPGRSLIDQVAFAFANQPQHDRLPDSVRVEVDTGGDPQSTVGAERECKEDNNDRSHKVEPGEARADLSLKLGAATVDCLKSKVKIPITVTNNGGAPAENVKVRFYTGDPSQGGAVFSEIILDKPLAPGTTIEQIVELDGFPNNRKITFWGVVDPDDEIEECNEGDNGDPADNPVVCYVTPKTR